MFHGFGMDQVEKREGEPGSAFRKRSLFGDVHDAFHQQPVAWKGAHVRIVTCFSRCREFDGLTAIWHDELGVGDDVVFGSIWDIAFGHGLWVSHHGVGLGTDGHFFAWLDQDKVMRLRGNAASIVQG